MKTERCGRIWIEEKMTQVQANIDREAMERHAHLYRIRGNHELLASLDGRELRIYMKNHYYQFRNREATWPLSNFEECSEMVADPVFSAMHDLYKRTDLVGNLVYYSRADDSLPIETTLRLALNDLATQMANRTMTRGTYDALKDEIHPVFHSTAREDVQEDTEKQPIYTGPI